ncbi:MAG: hypothetical protein JNL21_00160 [Myxococcales bacterium]|nr:hypothetical protein [Myxococcales bacterium]
MSPFGEQALTSLADNLTQAMVGDIVELKRPHQLTEKLTARGYLHNAHGRPLVVGNAPAAAFMPRPGRFMGSFASALLRRRRVAAVSA